MKPRVAPIPIPDFDSMTPIERATADPTLRGELRLRAARIQAGTSLSQEHAERLAVELYRRFNKASRSHQPQDAR